LVKLFEPGIDTSAVTGTEGGTISIVAESPIARRVTRREAIRQMVARCILG